MINACHKMNIPGSLHQTEQSAGLQKGHHCHTPHCRPHGFRPTDPPVGRGLTAMADAFLALRHAPLEQAESEEQAEAGPHASCHLLASLIC